MIRRLVSIIVFSSAMCVAVTASTQERPPPGFPAFWTRFQAALAKDDKEIVIEMMVSPFYWSGPMDKASLLQNYPKLFSPKVKQCFRTAKPLPDGPFYNVFCGEQLFRFGDQGGHWRLLEIADND